MPASPVSPRELLRCCLLLALAAASACTYLGDRARDLRDVFTADVGIGLGIGVDLQATDAVHTGLGGGVYYQWQLGRPTSAQLDGELTGVQSAYSFLLYRSSGPHALPDHVGFLWNALYWPDYFDDPPHGRDWSGRSIDLPLSKSAVAPWLNLLDVDVGVMALPVSARIGFSPGEALDFVVGIFGLDLAGDDGPRAKRTLVQSEALTPANPSFPTTFASAQRDLDRMRAQPARLERPVFVLGGLMDSSLAKLWAADLRHTVVAEQQDWVIPVTFLTHLTFDSCRTALLETVAARCEQLHYRGPVDIVAHSMGGLIARHAAAAPEPRASCRKRLDLLRLFTVATPHRGARLAEMPSVHPLARAMRAGSRFLRRLDEQLPAASYCLYPYTLHPDSLIGSQNAAPEGEPPWWLLAPPRQAAHVGSMADPRLLAEIARHLRGEPGLATLPRAPLPN